MAASSRTVKCAATPGGFASQAREMSDRSTSVAPTVQSSLGHGCSSEYRFAAQVDTPVAPADNSIDAAVAAISSGERNDPGVERHDVGDVRRRVDEHGNAADGLLQERASQLRPEGQSR